MRTSWPLQNWKSAKFELGYLQHRTCTKFGGFVQVHKGYICCVNKSGCTLLGGNHTGHYQYGTDYRHSLLRFNQTGSGWVASAKYHSSASQVDNNCGSI